MGNRIAVMGHQGAALLLVALAGFAEAGCVRDSWAQGTPTRGARVRRADAAVVTDASAADVASTDSSAASSAPATGPREAAFVDEVLIVRPRFASRWPVPWAVERVVTEHEADVRRCLQEGAQRTADLQGTLTVEWTIDARGVVTDAAVVTALADQQAGTCVTDAIRGWRFLPLDGTGTVHVRYGFAMEWPR